MGNTGPVQIRYGARTLFIQIDNGGSRFLENIYTGKILLRSFLCIIFTLDTICADNKDKPIAG